MGKKECPCQHTFTYCQQYNNNDQNTLWDTKSKSETATKTPSQFIISPLHVSFFCKNLTFNLNETLLLRGLKMIEYKLSNLHSIKSLSFQVKKVTHFKRQYTKLYETEFMTLIASDFHEKNTKKTA
jgi:hypothetical protein